MSGQKRRRELGRAWIIALALLLAPVVVVAAAGDGTDGQPFKGLSSEETPASVTAVSSACEFCLDLCNQQWWECRQNCGTSFKCSHQICDPQLTYCSNSCYSSSTCP